MKILMLGWELPPHNSGGLGVACYQLSKALAAQGCQIDFVLPYTADHSNIDFMRVLPALPYSPSHLQAKGNAYQSYKFDAEHTAGDLRATQRIYAKAAKQIAAQGGYDVVHAHDWLTYEAAAEVRQATAAPIVAHVHATEYDRSGEFYGNPLVHEVEQLGLTIADHIVAVSDHTKQTIVRNYNVPANKVAVIHNSVEPADFQPTNDRNIYTYLAAMKRQGYKVVVSTNRFTPQKGMTYFLRAAQAALSKNPKLLFLLCGTGDQYNELVQLSAELGIAQNVLFPGFVRGTAWRDAYRIGDVFVMSSVSEPFGLSALESVGYGVVTIVSKQSGVREVVRNMLSYDYWDTDKLADYIVNVAERDGLHQVIRYNASQEFKNLSWAKIAQEFTTLYQHRLQKVAA